MANELPANLTVQYTNPHPSYHLGKVIALVVDKTTTAVYACAYGETHEDARSLALERYFRDKH